MKGNYPSRLKKDIDIGQFKKLTVFLKCIVVGYKSKKI